MSVDTTPNQRYLSAQYLYELAADDAANEHWQAAELRQALGDVLLEVPVRLERAVELAMLPLRLETSPWKQAGYAWAWGVIGYEGGDTYPPAAVALAQAIIDVCGCIDDLRGEL